MLSRCNLSNEVVWTIMLRGLSLRHFRAHSCVSIEPSLTEEGDGLSLLAFSTQDRCPCTRGVFEGVLELISILPCTGCFLFESIVSS